MKSLTKKALIDAFCAMCESKPLDKITVQDIVDKCGVNRNTFYYHFQDIYSVLETILQSELNSRIEDIDAGNTWEDCIRNALHYVLTHKKMVKNIASSMNRKQVEIYIKAILDKAIDHYLKMHYDLMAIDKEDYEIVLHFFTYAFLGLVMDMIDNELYVIDDKNSDEMIRRMSRVIDRNFKLEPKNAKQ